MYNGIEEDIIKFIKPHLDFSETINQYEITSKVNDEREKWMEQPIKPRRIRRVIERLIEQGYPIISTSGDPGGYCWKGGPGEALKCYKVLRRKAAKEFIRARYTLRNYRIGQQRTLFDITDQ